MTDTTTLVISIAVSDKSTTVAITRTVTKPGTKKEEPYVLVNDGHNSAYNSVSYC